MRVLVQALCLVGAASFMMKVPDSDEYCDRGTKREADGSWYCCPRACGGQCLNTQQKCDNAQKAGGADAYNPSCCIPTFKAEAKGCKESSSPCKMDKEWTHEQKTAQRAADYAAASNQVTKNYGKKIEEHDNPAHKAVETAKAMTGSHENLADAHNLRDAADADAAGWEKFPQGSPAWQLEEGVPMSNFNDAFAGCANIFKSNRKDFQDKCLTEMGTVADMNGLHKDHELKDGKCIHKCTFGDFYWGMRNPTDANGFASCVAKRSETEYCKDSQKTNIEGRRGDCDECKKLQQN